MSTASTESHSSKRWVPEENATPENTVHILITQCLQNGFFLSESSRLVMPPNEVERMLIGNQALDKSDVEKDEKTNRRYLNQEKLKSGPLYLFFETMITKPNRNAHLHVIHLKDWHNLSDQYDAERRLYGGHCEANTWEAEPLDGYEPFLRPWGMDAQKRRQGQSLAGFHNPKWPKVKFYEVLADSVYDFRFAGTIHHEEDIQSQLNALRKQNRKTDSHLSLLLDKIIADKTHIYITVIGVYTDIKIKTLLTGLRSRYDVPNLIVSDVLTAAPSLERHLAGLDFADKVLNVEIVSNLNTIISVMDIDESFEGKSSEEPQIPLSLTEHTPKWRNYRNYYLDKQNVLAYQDQRLAQYLQLTTERSEEIYHQVYVTNRYLTWIGRIFVIVLLILIVLDATGLADISLELFVIAGVASFSQIIPLFITGPQDRMRENLATLVRLRNYLETYSMTSAILRHHLTSPQRLEHDTSIENVEQQIDLISQAASGLRENFMDISGRLENALADTRTNTGPMAPNYDELNKRAEAPGGELPAAHKTTS